MEKTLLENDMQRFRFGETVTKEEVKTAYEIVIKVITLDKEKQMVQMHLHLVQAFFEDNKPINLAYVKEDIPIFERYYELIQSNDERNVVAKVCKWMGADRFGTVYISYASSNDDNPRIDDIEKRLHKLFELFDIPCEVYTNSNEKLISDFEKNIGKAKIVVVVLTDKYFKSSHCMNEWTLIHMDTRGKTILYVKNDDEMIRLNNKHVLKNGFNFDDSKYLKSINDHWKKKRRDYENIDRNVSQPTEVQISDSRHNFYREEFITINNYLRNIQLHKTSELCEFKVLDLIKDCIFHK